MKLVKFIVLALSVFSVAASAKFDSSILFTYYSDSSKTEEVGFYYIPCYGQSLGIIGTKTNDYDRETSDACQTDDITFSSKSGQCFIKYHYEPETDPETGEVFGYRKLTECLGLDNTNPA
ncbi:MAG: hypothetical protein HRT37_18170 [Alteromonadaceae bacterium]|nr:hypothetical protein [Alteromonadaceae bacterium]